MTIAVDFDGCLCTRNWPEIGEPNWNAIHELIRRKARGDKIILWTCRDGKQLEDAVMWSYNHGLKFDAVNENLPAHKEYFGNDTREIYADEYWGDKAVLVSANLQDSIPCLTASTGAAPVLHEKPLEKKPGLFQRMIWRLQRK